MKQNLFLFPNKGLKAIFEYEIKGQLSDGAWENAQPSNHWHFWCMVETAISSVGKFEFIKNGGVEDFHIRHREWYYKEPAKRTGYNLTCLIKDYDLSPRMRGYYVDAMYNFGMDRNADLFVNDNGTVMTEDSIIELCKQSEYRQKNISLTLKDRPLTEFLVDFTNKYNSYTRKQLVNDLKDIKAGMQMVISSF